MSIKAVLVNTTIDQNANERDKHNVVHGKKSLIRGKIMLVTFTRDKETKNTVRFNSPVGNEVSGSIYVQKGSEFASQKEIVIEIVENVEVTA